MKWSDGLEGPHLQIASSNSKKIAILAGPGTGKTKYGLLRRIMRLVQEDGVPPEEILFLTFTRTSAIDFIDKLDEFEIEGSGNITASTIHSFCFKYLRDEQIFRIFQRKTDRILLDYEEDFLLRDMDDKFGNIFKKRKLLLEFSNGWAKNPKDYPTHPKNDLEKEFQNEILKWLNYHKALLIGEVVPLVYNILLNNPELEILKRFSNIIIDEYQDLSATEQELINLLSQNQSVCVAGDDDQSIYSFRCANPEGIRQFFDGASEKITIDICGRCPQPILNIANDIKEHFPIKSKGPMICRNSNLPGKVEYVQWQNQEDECNGIATAVVKDIKDGRFEPGEILVLIQSKELGKSISKKIKELGTECKSSFSDDPIANEEGKKAITLLHLLANNSDPVSLRSWLGFGDSAGRKDQYKKLCDQAISMNISVKETLEKIGTGEINKNGFNVLAKRYFELSHILNKLQDSSNEEIIDALLPGGDSSLEELRQIALSSNLSAKTITDLVHKIDEAITRPEIPEHPDFVRVMSLHKSKGLTCGAVYVCGLVEGLIPKGNNTTTVEEARRLFYVAVTRASKYLVLSNFISVPFTIAFSMGITTGNFAGIVNGIKTSRTIASRFFQEINKALPKSVTGQKWLDMKIN